MGRPTVVAGNSDAVAAFDEAGGLEDTRELDVELEPDDDAAPGSVLAQLRTQAEVRRQVRTLELELAGPFSLAVRYRVLNRREWDKYAVLLMPNVNPAAANADAAPMSVLNVRMMAAACETVLFVDDAGERHDLELRLDDGRLAEATGYPLPDGMAYDDLGALELVEWLFPSPMAVTAHAGELVTWMQNPSDPGSAEGEG